MPLVQRGVPTVDSPAVNTPRRYWLLKLRRMRDWLWFGLELAYRSKQLDGAGVSFPDNFPELRRLAAARYYIVEDLYGADIDELVYETALALDPAPGFTQQTAQSVLVALNALIAQRTTVGYNISTGPFAGTYANTRPAVVLASTTDTASNASPTSLELGDRGTLRLTLAITAASGTLPTLDVTIQTSGDGVTWRNISPTTANTTFPQQTGVGTVIQSFPGCDRFVRAPYVIGGTLPSFTFSVTGEAV